MKPAFTPSPPSTITRQPARAGFLQVDLAVALVVFALALLPLGYTYGRERKLLKIEYERAVAVQLVDSELEIVLAGAGQGLAEGSQPYPVKAAAAASLPPGHFESTKHGRQLRLEWLPDAPRGVGPVRREAVLP